MRAIKSSREIEELFRHGRRVSHPLLTLLYRRTPEGRGPQGRVAFIAGKKTGNAVRRNRGKRILRVAARAADGPWPGYDVALVARKATADADATQVTSALRQLLYRAGIEG